MPNQNQPAFIETPTFEFPIENRAVENCLKEGANYFGSNPANSIVFPGEAVAPFAGILFLRNNSVLMRVASSVDIKHNQISADNLVIYTEDIALVLTYGELKFRILMDQGKLVVSFITLTR